MVDTLSMKIFLWKELAWTISQASPSVPAATAHSGSAGGCMTATVNMISSNFFRNGELSLNSFELGFCKWVIQHCFL